MYLCGGNLQITKHGFPFPLMPCTVHYIKMMYCKLTQSTESVSCDLTEAHAHLEAHEGRLARSDVAAIFGDTDAGDGVRMSREELLLLRADVLNHNGAADRVDEMWPTGVNM